MPPTRPMTLSISHTMPSSSRRNQDILAIARLHYEERLAQNEVAERLGISASTVSRALKKAHDLGFVEIRIVPSALRDEDCEKRLVERFGLRAAVVVQSRETLAEARRLLGAALAYHLDPLIAENDVIGISDGQTVAAVAAAMRRARARNISVVPLIGGIGLPQLPICTSSHGKRGRSSSSPSSSHLVRSSDDSRVTFLPSCRATIM